MDYIDDDSFQVSVKGLFFKGDKIFMIQEDNGRWEIPGGRVQKNEDLLEGLRRECIEEVGVECKILDERPLVVYSAVDDKGRARLMVFYKIDFENTDFKLTSECVDYKFFTKDEMKDLETFPQIEKLAEYL